MRRGLRLFSSVLIAAGLLLLADAALTVAWKEPVSALYARFGQEQLQDDLRTLERAAPPPVQRRALRALPRPRARIAFLARTLKRSAKPGQAIGRIRAGSIGLSQVVVAGTATGDLRKGPGHFPATPLPGVHGTVAVAGHRTTYGAPFRKLDALDRRDLIELEMPYGRFTYRVQRTRIVPPTATWVTRRVDHDRLVLTACHPLYSAAQRIVVFARLERVVARGAALKRA